MKYLSGKEKKQLGDKLPKGYEVSKKDNITEKEGLLYKDDEPFLIIDENGEYLPHLKSIDSGEYAHIYVDKGAVPFVLKGADMMRPGIEKIDSGIEEGDIIVISHEGYDKPLGIGRAMFNSEEMGKMDKGKCIQSLHYINDKYY